MMQKMRTPLVQERRVAEKSEELEHSEFIFRDPKNQAPFWHAFQLAVEIDLIERTTESRTLRTVAHRVWRSAFLAEGGTT